MSSRRATGKVDGSIPPLRCLFYTKRIKLLYLVLTQNGLFVKYLKCLPERHRLLFFNSRTQLDLVTNICCAVKTWPGLCVFCNANYICSCIVTSKAKPIRLIDEKSVDQHGFVLRHGVAIEGLNFVLYYYTSYNTKTYFINKSTNISFTSF